MILRPPRSTRTAPLFPYPALCRSVEWTRVALAAVVAILVISSLRSAIRILTLSHPEGAAARLEAPARVLQLLLRPISFLLSAPTAVPLRSEEHTSELQSLMRISYAVFCLNKKKKHYIYD